MNSIKPEVEDDTKSQISTQELKIIANNNDGGNPVQGNQYNNNQQQKRWVFDMSKVRNKGYNPLKFDISKAREAFGYNEKHDCITCGLHGFVTSLCPCHNTYEQARANQDAFFKRREDDKIVRGYSNHRGNRGGYQNRGRGNYYDNSYSNQNSRGNYYQEQGNNNGRNEYGYGNRPMYQREFYNSNQNEVSYSSQDNEQQKEKLQEQKGVRGNVIDSKYKQNEVNQVHDESQSINGHWDGC